MFVSYYLQKFRKLLVSRTKNCFLWPTFLLRGLFIPLTQQSVFKILLNVLRVSLGCIVVGFTLIREKRKLAKTITRCHSLSLAVIRCDSLSFAVSRCHSLSLVVSRCTTRCITHSSVFRFHHQDHLDFVKYLIKVYQFKKV